MLIDIAYKTYINILITNNIDSGNFKYPVI